MLKLNRNEPCPCGSGKKYKKCCFLEPLKEDEIQRALSKSTSLAEVQALLSEPPTLYHIKVELVRHPCHDLDHKEVSRTFLIAGMQSLYNLHLKIQRAFDWDNDHMFSFYLSNKLFDSTSEYSAAPDGEHYPSNINAPTKAAALAELRDLDLSEGREFLYLFDYGDKLIHQVTILEITETDQHKPVAFQLTGSVGENVDQYHAYENENEEPAEG
ncbi:IS1096 element passenger TnpR family protein [Endozoicomonas sp.]|uniref:IS1096 element passenger TnpR family protein n=1 Tax=Endozoicomonas sp. TaxID=1892382 RepID=UPI002885AB4E|nr:SEC-C metal-binding domain-containing protein [Endozoicomonas sp.]